MYNIYIYNIYIIYIYICCIYIYVVYIYIYYYVCVILYVLQRIVWFQLNSIRAKGKNYSDT
jgi:hypothetical protein